MKITNLTKTIARRISTGKHRLILYLQPNGVIVLRHHHGRRRYVINLDTILERALLLGPADGLLSMEILDASRMRSNPKRGKGIPHETKTESAPPS